MGGDEDPGKRKTRQVCRITVTGGRIILLIPGMLHCKRTKHRIPGARGRASLPAHLTEHRELGRGPADITTGGLIPSEGSPIVNALLARHTTLDRPAWATPGVCLPCTVTEDDCVPSRPRDPRECLRRVPTGSWPLHGSERETTNVTDC